MINQQPWFIMISDWRTIGLLPLETRLFEDEEEQVSRLMPLDKPHRLASDRWLIFVVLAVLVLSAGTIAVSIDRIQIRLLSIELSMRFDPETTVLRDAHRLRRILVNVLGNAIKFTNKGRVSVVVSNDYSESRDWYDTKVTDTGIGMPADRLDALFTPFTQADSTTTRRFGGTGLGLAICRQLTELMGGTISAQSVEGVGSAFTLELPLPSTEQPVTRTAPDYANVAAFGLDVLVAEDNPTNRWLMEQQLTALGCEANIRASSRSSAASSPRNRGDGSRRRSPDRGDRPEISRSNAGQVIQPREYDFAQREKFLLSNPALPRYWPAMSWTSRETEHGS